MNSRVSSEKSALFGFKSFKPFLTFITCSLSFVLEISLFCWGGGTIWVSPLQYQLQYQLQYVAKVCTVFWRTLCTIKLDMPVISTLSLREYSAFLQHWRSREATCFTWTSDSSLLKLTFNIFILSLNLDIVLFVYFCILRNKPIIRGLAKDLKVSSI